MFELFWPFGFGLSFDSEHLQTYWKQVFRRFDVNNNGYIDYSEFVTMYSFAVYTPPDPDGALWDIGLNTVFDVNVPTSQLASGSLKRLNWEGARHILALSSKDYLDSCSFLGVCYLARLY
jgi:hypothetical protein